MPSLFALCTLNEEVRFPTTVTASIGHNPVVLDSRSRSLILRCPLRIKLNVSNRSICTKMLLISINDILLLNKYKPAGFGNFFFCVCAIKESLIDLWRRRVSFSGFKTQIKHPQNTITQFLLSPFHH